MPAPGELQFNLFIWVQTHKSPTVTAHGLTDDDVHALDEEVKGAEVIVNSLAKEISQKVKQSLTHHLVVDNVIASTLKPKLNKILQLHPA